jgi:hypothetical protein
MVYGFAGASNAAEVAISHFSILGGRFNTGNLWTGKSRQLWSGRDQ